MSIQSFTEKLLSTIDEDFARGANNLLNEARQDTGKEQYLAGHMDGLSDAVKRIKETYSLFVKSEDDKDEDEKALY